MLRGPQGTLAGKNSIGGAVKLYSKRPDGNDGGVIEAAYGSYDRIDLRASTNLTLIEDQLFLRFAGVYKKKDGHVTRKDYGCLFPGEGVLPVSPGADCVLGHMGGTDFKGLRGALRWTPNDRLDVTIIGDMSSDTSEPNAQRLILGTIPDVQKFVPTEKFTSYQTFRDIDRAFTPAIENKVNAQGLSGQIQYELTDNLHLTSITALRKYDGALVIDQEGGPGGPGLQNSKLKFESFTQEVRLSGSALDDRLRYTLGGYYYEGDGRQGGRVDLATNDFVTDDVVLSDAKSAFAHLEYDLVEGLTVSAGLRYTDESKSYTFSRTKPDGTKPVPTVGVLDGLESVYSGDRWDYRLNASYAVTPEFMVYGTLSTGFRGGGVNPRPYTILQAVPFNPETLIAYEVGFKSDLFDRRVRLNVSGFINKYDNILLTILNGYADFPISAIPLNAGKADVKGVEVETTIRPVDGLLIDGSFGYLDFQYTDISAGGLASGIDKGDVAPYSPKYKASLGAQYEFNIAGDATLTPRFDLNYQGAFYTNADNNARNRNAAYTVANARLTFRPTGGQWEAALSVTNLFDKYYYSNVYDNTASSRAVIASVARPREWAVHLKRHF